MEERYRINTECMKQNLSMQHYRDLQIVRDEAQRRPDDALSQVRSSEEKTIAQSRQIENLQSQIDQLAQLIRQQQQAPPNAATPQHIMAQQHIFPLTPPIHSHIHQNTQDMFNQSLNNTLIGVLDKVEKSMVQQNNVLSSVTALKEHYLSNVKPCDGKIALDLAHG